MSHVQEYLERLNHPADASHRQRAGHIWRMSTPARATAAYNAMSSRLGGTWHPDYSQPPSRFMLWMRVCYNLDQWGQLLLYDCTCWTPRQRKRFCQWLLLINAAIGGAWVRSDRSIPELVVLVMEVDKYNARVMKDDT